MKAYKAFDAGYICRGYEYTDKEHCIKGKVELCHNGFHACLNPHFLFNYYNVQDKNTVFAIVDISDDVAFSHNTIKIDDKVAASRIEIVKKFNSINDLYEDFDKNGNPTIEYILSNHKAFKKRNKPKDKTESYKTCFMDIQAYRDIVYKKDKKITLIKETVFSLLVMCEALSDEIDLLEKCSKELSFISEALEPNHKEHRRVFRLVKNKIANFDKYFTDEEYKEFLEYVNEIKRLFDIDIVEVYQIRKKQSRDKNRNNCLSYREAIINLPKMEGDIQ